MALHHDAVINAKLEEVLTNGCAYISWNELHLWYGQKRIAVGVYRDLATRWENLLGTLKDLSSTGWNKPASKLGKLMMVQSPMNYSAGIHLFAEKMAQPVHVDQ